MTSNSEVNFLVDTLLIETVLADPKFYKKAGFVSDLLTKAKEYFGAHINQQDKLGSVLNILGPGLVSMVFSALGFGKFGFLLGLLMEVFHVDVKGLLSSLANKVRGMVSGGEKVSSEQINTAVAETAQEFSQPVSEEDAKEGYQALQQRQQVKPEGSFADDGKVYSSLELLDDAKMISLALITYEHQQMRLTKEAIGFSSFLPGFNPTRAKGATLLSTIFGWLIKVILVSGGLMVAGDVANKVVGRPNALDQTYQAGKEPVETGAPAVPSGPVSTQTKFKFKGDASLPRTWPLVNNPSNIESMLVQFAKDTYDGLDGKESIIESSPAFQSVQELLEWFNIHNPGSAVILIPRSFTSKKQLVDHFIDDVAKATP